MTQGELWPELAGLYGHKNNGKAKVFGCFAASIAMDFEIQSYLLLYIKQSVTLRLLVTG